MSVSKKTKSRKAIFGKSNRATKPSGNKGPSKKSSAPRKSPVKRKPPVRKTSIRAQEQESQLKILQEYWSRLPTAPDEDEWLSGRI